MRRVVLAAALTLAVGNLPAAAAGVQATGFAFGRVGGSIRPYDVTISNGGVVRSFGPVEVRRTRVAPARLATLNRIATETGFATLPAATNCPGALPDVAATYVRVGPRTVRVHGACLPRYQRLLRALQASVG